LKESVVSEYLKGRKDNEEKEEREAAENSDLNLTTEPPQLTVSLPVLTSGIAHPPSPLKFSTTRTKNSSCIQSV